MLQAESKVCSGCQEKGNEQKTRGRVGVGRNRRTRTFQARTALADDSQPRGDHLLEVSAAGGLPRVGLLGKAGSGLWRSERARDGPGTSAGGAWIEPHGSSLYGRRFWKLH